MPDKNNLWQPLPWNNWSDTQKTLHLFTQIIGKIRLELMPMMQEWAQAPFTLTSTGIDCIGLPAYFGSFDITFDFINHKLNVSSSDSRSFSFSLKDISVAEFYKEIVNILNELGVMVKIHPMSVEMLVPIKLDTDEVHKTYDEEWVVKWWHILIEISRVFNEFRGKFMGKQTPVNFWWGSFDLSITLFSGNFASLPGDSNMMNKVAMDAEQSTIGFWPGSDDFPQPAFFSYTFPKPEGFEKAKLNDDDAKWSDEKGEFILLYEDVIKQADPGKFLFEFCESVYLAGATLAGWDVDSLKYKMPQ